MHYKINFLGKLCHVNSSHYYNLQEYMLYHVFC